MLSLDLAIVTLAFAFLYGFALKDKVLSLLAKYGFLMCAMITLYQMLADYSSPLSASLGLLVVLTVFLLVFAIDLFFSFIPILQAFAKKRR